jgi:hypothetical protein
MKLALTKTPTRESGGNLKCMTRSGISIVSLLLTLLIGGSTLLAQTALSVLRGTVTDDTGAALPGVNITLTDLATNIRVRTVITDGNGNYEIPDLKLGSYRLNAEKAGFRAHVTDNLLMDAGQTRRFDFSLQVGEATETVTVNGGAAVITTEGGGIGGEVNSRKFKDQPAVDTYPSPLAMLTTVPGIQGSGWNLMISGQSRTQQTWAMDGVANDITGDQNDNPNFFETVQVSTVLSGADSARVTNFNMVSKRGSSAFHGGAFYRHFNSGLNSRTYIEADSNRRKTPFIQHEFFAEASGPIWKDKTFFYFGWFRQNLPLGSFVTSSVPTVNMRQGIFSTFIKDPLLTGLCQATPANPAPGIDYQAACFHDGTVLNKIPANRINPVSQRILDLYFPAPNIGGPNTLTNNYGYIFPYNSDLYKGDWPFLRIDHKVSEKNSLFFRWSARITPYIRPRPTPDLGWTESRDHRQTVISDTHVFSPNLINTFTFGWQTDFRRSGEPEKGFEPLTGDEVIAAIGLQGTNQGGYSTQGFPRIAITGLSTLETQLGGIDNVRDDNYIRTWLNTLTWSKGRHVLKFGGEYREFQNRNPQIPTDTYGNFSFDGTFTGNAVADFLLGIPITSTRLNPLPDRISSEKQVGAFVGDTFKITDKLTLDFGLRWDYYSAPTFKDGLMFNWDPATGNVIVAPGTLSQVNPAYPQNTTRVLEGEVVPTPDKRNFRPRIAAAYRITDKMVVRGGYGEYTEVFGYFSRLLGSGPFQFSETYRNTTPAPTLFFPNPFPSNSTIPGQDIQGYPMQTDNGVVRQYNLSVEQEWRDMGFRISYIGSRSTGINYNLNINKPQPSTTPFVSSRQPFPQFRNVTVTRDDGEVKYDSLQLSAQRRIGSFMFDASWTWSNNMYNYANLENPYSVTDKWARNADTRRHYFVINTNWMVPVGHGRRFLSGAPDIVNQVIGGWDMQTITYFGTGTYFSPSFSGSDPSNTGTSGGLPDRIADGNKSSDERSYTQWFDPSAFKVPAAGTFGNSGVNILEGQGIKVFHLSLAKRFPITERWRMSFTTAISNLFNTPHFGNPNLNINTADPGKFTATIPYYNPEKQGFRQMNMTLRLEF